MPTLLRDYISAIKLLGGLFTGSFFRQIPARTQSTNCKYKTESELDRIVAKQKAKRPTRDEFELEDLGNQLIEAKQEESIVSLTVWGVSEPVVGRITVLDARTRLVHVEQHGSIRKVPFMDVMKVDYAR